MVSFFIPWISVWFEYTNKLFSVVWSISMNLLSAFSLHCSCSVMQTFQINPHWQLYTQQWGKLYNSKTRVSFKRIKSHKSQWKSLKNVAVCQWFIICLGKHAKKKKNCQVFKEQLNSSCKSPLLFALLQRSTGLLQGVSVHSDITVVPVIKHTQQHRLKPSTGEDERILLFSLMLTDSLKRN